jgi:hypothetical protein
VFQLLDAIRAGGDIDVLPPSAGRRRRLVS